MKKKEFMEKFPESPRRVLSYPGSTKTLPLPPVLEQEFFLDDTQCQFFLCALEQVFELNRSFHL